MNKQLASLMQQEMTRKEFLTALGFGIATVLGFGSLLRLLTGKQAFPIQQHSTVSNGYGSNAYGGSRH